MMCDLGGGDKKRVKSKCIIEMSVGMGMSEKWAVRYPRISDALASTSAIVAQLRENERAELEIRLGMWKADSLKFVPGVSRGQIERVIDMMQESHYVTGDHDWIEEQDFFFNADGVQCRTRVQYDSTTMQITPTTIQKKNLASQTFVVVDRNAPIGIDLRVSLKSEDTVDAVVPPCVQTTLVRIKQRRRFTTLDGAWAFDFSMSWSGATKTKAELQQSSSDPVFEIECELLDAPTALASKDDARIAASLLLKACDLLPSNTCCLRSIEQLS